MIGWAQPASPSSSHHSATVRSGFQFSSSQPRSSSMGSTSGRTAVSVAVMVRNTSACIRREENLFSNSMSELSVHSDPLREQLLDAAARVFARQGYAGTKIQDIVREAGLSTGAVYGRFRSKDELLREAVIRRSNRIAQLGEIK